MKIDIHKQHIKRIIYRDDEIYNINSMTTYKCSTFHLSLSAEEIAVMTPNILNNQ